MLDSKSGLSLEDGIDGWNAEPLNRRGNLPGVRAIRRNKILIASCGLLFFLLALIYGALRPATYTASSQLLVYNKELLPGPETVITPGRTDASLVQNQIEIIQSRNLLLKVVDDLGLREDDEFVARKPGFGQYLRQWLAPFNSSELPEPLDERSLDGRRAVEALKANLAVRRVGTSHTITVSFRGSNPNKAALVTNQIVNTYLGDQMGAWKAGQSSNPWLRERLMSLGANARVISEADPPIRPDGPRLIVLLAGATLVGLLVGAALAFLRAILDRTVRTSDQAATTFGVECLGIIPKLKAGRILGVKDPGGLNVALRNDLWTHSSSGVLRFRRLRAALLEQPNIRILGVTSTLPGEGATTIAANAARFLAEAGSKVLLIDGAFHDFSLSRAIALTPGARTKEPANKNDSMDGTIMSRKGSSLHFLPADFRRKKDADAVWNTQIDNFVRDAAETYDFVVIDLPPLTSGAEVRIAAQTIDALLLVIKWGATRTETIQGALRSSGKAQLKVLGFVLNMANLKKMRLHGEKISLDETGSVAPSTVHLPSTSQAVSSESYVLEAQTIREMIP